MTYSSNETSYHTLPDIPHIHLDIFLSHLGGFLFVSETAAYAKEATAALATPKPILTFGELESNCTPNVSLVLSTAQIKPPFNTPTVSLHMETEGCPVVEAVLLRVKGSVPDVSAVAVSLTFPSRPSLVATPFR